MKSSAMDLRLVWVPIIGITLCLAIGQVRADEGEVCDLVGKGCLASERVKAVRTAEPVKSVKDQVAQRSQSSNARDASSPSITLAKGSEHAAITIIEYSDFGCSACARAAQVLDEVMKAYPDEIRVVFKPYPSMATPDALLIHEAAMAAGEQGKFWEMRDRLMTLKGTGSGLTNWLKRLDQLEDPACARRHWVLIMGGVKGWKMEQWKVEQ